MQRRGKLCSQNSQKLQIQKIFKMTSEKIPDKKKLINSKNSGREMQSVSDPR